MVIRRKATAVSIAPLRTGPVNHPDESHGWERKHNVGFNRTFANRPGEPLTTVVDGGEIIEMRFNRTFANRPGEPWAKATATLAGKTTTVSIAPLRTGPVNHSTAAKLNTLVADCQFQSHLCEPAR